MKPTSCSEILKTIYHDGSYLFLFGKRRSDLFSFMKNYQIQYSYYFFKKLVLLFNFYINLFGLLRYAFVSVKPLLRNVVKWSDTLAAL